MALYLLKVYTTREEMGARWEVGIVKRLPIPPPTSAQHESVSEISNFIYGAKAEWDRGNETMSAFEAPWLIRSVDRSSRQAISGELDALLEFEHIEEQRIQDRYSELDETVFRLYGVSDATLNLVEETLGRQPSETLWQQMLGKLPDQKRIEHVWRLLSYAVKRVAEADKDGIVPFLHVSGESPLLDRVHAELGKLFPGRDVNEIEVEIVNELRRKVKGYERVESIRQWLEDLYFAYHSSMYKNRPIFWHISSKQGKGPAAFSALVHYQRFDKDRIAKLRGVYLREALGVFRREAALASQAGRADDRLEWQARVEEAEELDRRLQKVQEGFHQGGEDFRILTPWKAEGERPKGWDPDINDGVKVNIEPLQRAGVLRIPEVV